MDVIYKTLAGIDKRFFDCDRLQSLISTDACAANFAKAKTLAKDCGQSITRCLDCPTGARHAGVEYVPKVMVVGSMTCARCHRQSSRIVCDGICPSCHARQREVERGFNAKGTAPHPVERFWGVDMPTGKTVKIHTLGIAMRDVRGVDVVEIDRAADTLEVMLRACRNAKGPPVFSRRCSPLTAPSIRRGRFFISRDVSMIVEASRSRPNCQLRLF